MASDDPVQKVAISGPTLASMIQRISTSESDIDGLLFGHVNSSILSLSDDDPSTSTANLTATITSFIPAPTKPYFYNSIGQIDTPKLRSLSLPSLTLIGWFSGRRQTQSRPSMREFGVTRSLSATSEFHFPVKDSDSNFHFAPCLFLLLTTPCSSSDPTIHTYEYRAYQFQSASLNFEPRSIDIVNIGPAFRGHYGNFITTSVFPMLPFDTRRNPMIVDTDVSLSDKKKITNHQRHLDLYAQGFDLAKLSGLIGSEAVNYTSSLEDLYSSMLAKLEGLARQVENSNALVIEKENSNMKLRYKVAGLD
uniref:Uncharacterized protein n=1 Tax=Kalanchoe fedtschenkoi TaxID=63787 RepID=A0A7N0T344_KALFE